MTISGIFSKIISSETIGLIKQISIIAIFVTWASVGAVLTIQMLRLPGIAGRYVDSKIEPLEAKVLSISDNMNSLVRSTGNTVSDNYVLTRATLKATASLVKNSEEFVVDLRSRVNGGVDTTGSLHPGILPEVHYLLSDSRRTVTLLSEDVHKLFAGSEGITENLNVELLKIHKLTDDLDAQLIANGTASEQTLKALTSSVENLDTLISSSDVRETLANTNKITGHLAGSAESVDIALRPLREKARLLKVVLLKAVSLFKVTVNPF